MKIFKKVFVPLLASVFLCATVLPSVGNAEQITKSEVNLVQTEVIQTDRGEATVTTNFNDDNHRITTIVENGKTTKIEFFPQDQTLLIDGVKQENFNVKESRSDFSLNAVPSGGTFVGKFDYSYDWVNVGIVFAAGIISTVTKAPVSTILVIIGAGASLNTQSYYTIYQYSYPRKCEAIPYANHTVFYQDASRNKVIGTADSAKFFSSQPYPIGCTP
ncbi:hypothetical protein B4V02_01515 [Paenibacillus kribbensis]|uniref:Uncharacterized protein n=1 Tax=Paenibacillus kribbensis TaxID=172713 RepID=A0A222WH19_9BACL|nr:hypothetical protein [Paenibacillus kribbensis]ASR45475.1 hypothetical protein B4V02_01515 [Paenibacillus kribbensis]